MEGYRLAQDSGEHPEEQSGCYQHEHALGAWSTTRTADSRAACLPVKSHGRVLEPHSHFESSCRETAQAVSRTAPAEGSGARGSTNPQQTLTRTGIILARRARRVRR